MSLLTWTTRQLRRTVFVVGLLTILLGSWIGLGLPIGLHAWLNVGTTPVAADVIVCLGGGTGLPGLPGDAGWTRIFTATELFKDGLAPRVVFMGRGSQPISEAEIYARAAAWLGLPADRTAIDATSNSTADHPAALLRINGLSVTPTSRLLIVTSRSHARRALLTFRKAGYTNIRVITDYRARTPRPDGTASATRSSVPGFTPSTKSYDYALFRWSEAGDGLAAALREVAALGWYWWKGWV